MMLLLMLMFLLLLLMMTMMMMKTTQVKLVPLLRRSPAPSCPAVKSHAFESHVPCYVDPTGTGSPSFCDLSLGDKWEVFQTIWTAFGSEFRETIKGGLRVRHVYVR